MTEETTEKSTHWPALAVCLAISAAAIGVGQLYPPGQWFASLNKPAINPPGWVFPVVWTPLYVMIAVAGWLIWRAGPKSLGMKLWAVQMVLNVAWSAIFFGAHRPGLALIEITFLWLAIGATILA
ncbi:MAG: TspO/MBR family protein, partial [Lacipirellulaceae bacterium]